MPSPNATPTPITPPRVPLIDPRTGLIDRAWYLFFLSLQDIATSVVEDVDLATDSISLIASYDQVLQTLAQEVQTQPPTVDLSAELIKQLQEANLVDCCSALVSQTAEMQKQLEALNLLPPPAQGTVTAVTATAPVVSSGGTAPDISLAADYGDTQNPYAAKTANYVLASPNGSSGVPTFRALVAADIPALPYGAGTVTSVSVVSANGFAGTVATATTTPAITLTTSITGLLKGNGTAISAATSGTDYAPATSGTSILYGNGSGGFSNVTIGTNLTFSAGTLSASSSFPSGTAMLFAQTAAPTGWTKSTTHNNKALRVVSGAASSGGTVAFTTAFSSQGVSGTVGNTTLTTAQMPSHTHDLGLYPSGANAAYVGVATTFFNTPIFTSAATGGGGSHTHSFTGTAIDLAVQYVDVIIATKD